jgi:hypothetical protein
MNDYERRLISSLEAEEERLAFTRFDNVDAGRLGSALVVVRDRAVASGHDRYPAAGEIPETSAVALLALLSRSSPIARLLPRQRAYVIA